MAYHDDLYSAENLIGYTGEIYKMPTVYFRKGNKFGHITQFHMLPQNNGREEVGQSAEYSIGNEKQSDGKVRSVEKVGTTVIHTSRNPFKEASTLSADEKAVLVQAIWKYPEKKEIASMRDYVDDLLDQAERKEAVMADIVKLRK